MRMRLSEAAAATADPAIPGRLSGGKNKNPPASLQRAGGFFAVWGVTQASLALAISVSWVKAALSLTAISASIFRLISTPAFFRPFMKVE